MFRFVRTKLLCLLMCISLNEICGSFIPDETEDVSSINVPHIKSDSLFEPKDYKEEAYNNFKEDEAEYVKRQERDSPDYGDYQFDRDLPDLGKAELHLFSWWKGADGKKINVTTSSHLKLYPTNKLQGPETPSEATMQTNNVSLSTNITTATSENVTNPTVNASVTSASSVANVSTAPASSTFATTITDTGSTYLTTCYTVTDTCLPLLTLVAAPICTQESTIITSTGANATQGSTNSTTVPVTSASEAALSNTMSLGTENTNNTGSPRELPSTTPALVQLAQQAIPNPFNMVSGSMVIPIYRIPPATKIILINTPGIVGASTDAIESPVTEKFENNLNGVQLTESINAEENDFVNKNMQHNNINRTFIEENNFEKLGNMHSTSICGNALLNNNFITKEPLEILNSNFQVESTKNGLKNIEQSENIQTENGIESHEYLQFQNTVLNKPKNELVKNMGRDLDEKHKDDPWQLRQIKIDNQMNLLNKLNNKDNSFTDKKQNVYYENNLPFVKDRNSVIFKHGYTPQQYSNSDKLYNFGIPIHQNSSSSDFYKTTFSSGDKNNESFKTINVHTENLLRNDESHSKENNYLISRKPLMSPVTQYRQAPIIEHSFTKISNTEDKKGIKSFTDHDSRNNQGTAIQNSAILSHDNEITEHIDFKQQQDAITYKSIISQLVTSSDIPINKVFHKSRQSTNKGENNRQMNRLSTNGNISNSIKSNLPQFNKDSVDNIRLQTNRLKNVAITHLNESKNLKCMSKERQNLTSNYIDHGSESVNIYFKYNDTFLSRHSSNSKNLIDICKNVTCKGNDYLAQCCGQKICPPDKCKGEDFSYLLPIPGDTTTTSMKPCCKEMINKSLIEKTNLHDITHSQILSNFSNVRVTRENGMNDFVKFQLMHGITAPDGKDLLNALKEARIQIQKINQEFHPESGNTNVKTLHRIPIVQRQIFAKQQSEDKTPFIDTNKILERIRATISESLLHTKLRNNPVDEKYRTIRNQVVNRPLDIIKENVILEKLREESETELRRIAELELKRRQEEESFNREKEINLKELANIRQLVQNEVEKQKLSNSEKRDIYFPENFASSEFGTEGSYSKLVHQIANSVDRNVVRDLSFDRYSELKSSNVSNSQKSESSPVEIFLSENKFPELNRKEIMNEPNYASMTIINPESGKANFTKRKKRDSTREIVEQIDTKFPPDSENKIVDEKISNKIEHNFDSLHNDLFDLQKYLASKIDENFINRFSPEKLAAPINYYNNASYFPKIIQS